MVLLCEGCHSKVHDHNFVNHSVLIRAALERARRKGVKLGRPKGTTMEGADLLLRHTDIVKVLKADQSIRHAATKGTVERGA